MGLRVMLVGATGFTGELVARRLLAEGIEFTAVGRSNDRLAALTEELGLDRLDTEALDLTDPESLARLSQRGHLIVNCAGPFNLYGRALVSAAAANGTAYLDVSGEESFVGFSMSQLQDIAEQSGSVLVHACAFESLPADLMAALMLDQANSYSDISSYYRVPGNSASPGTRLTMRLAAHWPTTAYLDGEFRTVPIAGIRRPIDFPFFPAADTAVFVPYPELRFWPRRYTTQASASFLAMSRAEAALFGRTGTAGGRSVADIVERHVRSTRPGPAPAQRRSHRFQIGVVASLEDGRVEAAWLGGLDPYGFTAAIAAWSCRQLLEKSGAMPGGVYSPAEAFDSTAFFRAAADWDFGMETGGSLGGMAGTA